MVLMREILDEISINEDLVLNFIFLFWKAIVQKTYSVLIKNEYFYARSLNACKAGKTIKLTANLIFYDFLAN